MAINSLSTGFRPGICTSSTRPAAPYEGQQIYETDTDFLRIWNGSAWSQQWNMPWGVIGFTKSTTSQTGITTETLATGLSITFTAVANRYYKFVWYEPNLDSNGNVTCLFTGQIRLTNISGTVQQTSKLAFAGATTSNNHFHYLMGINTFAAGSVTLVCTSACTNSTSLLRSATAAGYFTVEDIGPA